MLHLSTSRNYHSVISLYSAPTDGQHNSILSAAFTMEILKIIHNSIVMELKNESICKKQSIFNKQGSLGYKI